MANILPVTKQIDVLKLLVEGNSIRSTVRITGVHKKTVTRLLVRFGSACRDFLDERMRRLTLDHIQCDEVWTFVQKKQARLTVEEKQTRHDIGDMFLWVAFDESTKLIPTFAIGKRSADNARRFMTDLAGRLVRPAPHQSDNHAFVRPGYQSVTTLSTDGFNAYPEAVDLAFGAYVKYGQLIKDFRNASMTYEPSEMIAADRRPIFGNISEDEICTSECVNSFETATCRF